MHALGKTLVLVGMMGAGKTSVGRRLAGVLSVPFRDADAEIEAAAGCTINEIFERFGEPEFRAGERKVILRLLQEPPRVQATGGGPFMDTETRTKIKENAISVWLKADVELLLERVARKDNRPLLRNTDSRAALTRLLSEREPTYSEADIIVHSDGGPHETVVRRILTALEEREDAMAAASGSPAEARTVPVALGDRSYGIHIGEGLIDRAGAMLAPFVGKSAPKRVPVVTDETVARLYYPRLQASLESAGLKPQAIVLPPGEQTKSFAHLERVVAALLDAEAERGTLIVALGGGVIGDLTGFAAGIVKRGLDFAQIPTTLLSQVDSSVGGKTAINTHQGKNLVGLFYQPRVVIADIAALKTLPHREMLGGYAEVAKYGLLGDAEFFAWLEKNASAALANDANALGHAVAHSCTMKAEIVARDERESGDRALLNLGHTFGHGLEAATGYSDRLIHGEGVALGCVLAFKLSAHLGLARPDDVARVEKHFQNVGLKTKIADIAGIRPTVEDILAHMRHDKKASGGRMTFILAKGIGRAFVSRDVPEEAVCKVLAEG